MWHVAVGSWLFEGWFFSEANLTILPGDNQKLAAISLDFPQSFPDFFPVFLRFLQNWLTKNLPGWPSIHQTCCVARGLVQATCVACGWCPGWWATWNCLCPDKSCWRQGLCNFFDVSDLCVYQLIIFVHIFFIFTLHNIYCIYIYIFVYVACIWAQFLPRACRRCTTS